MNKEFFCRGLKKFWRTVVADFTNREALQFLIAAFGVSGAVFFILAVIVLLTI